MMEGLPNMGMEAMARGRALIGSTVGGIPELIDDGLTGYLVPKNKPISLADKMEWCIRNSDKLENMGNRAHEKVVEYFNYDKGLKDYLQLYENHIKE
jgi:glycosyltransferase involved in cell wall biosynthesis